MKNKIILLGAGGQAKIVLDLLDKNHQYEVVAVLDDDEALHNTKILNSVVKGDIKSLINYSSDEIGFIVCIADNKRREEIFNNSIDLGYEPLNVISRIANISNFATLGKGIAIADMCNIHPDVILGDNIIIGPMTSVAHDSKVESHVHLSSGCRLAGNVTIQEYADLGTAVSVIPGKTIKKHSIIGAGAVVVKDIEPYSLAVGIPAKRIKSLE